MEIVICKTIKVRDVEVLINTSGQCEQIRFTDCLYASSSYKSITRTSDRTKAFSTQN